MLEKLLKRTLSRLRSPVLTQLLYAAGVLLCVGLSAALRLYLLANKAVWWDEGWSVYLARKPVAEIIRTAASTQHPPLHYLYLHYWLRLVGESEQAARLSSVLFGVATIPVVYALGRRLKGRAVGLGAAAFVAIAPFHICWSQEIRMYSAATFCAALSFLAFTECISRPRALAWVAYVLATSAMLYMHYGTLLVVAVQNLVALYALLRPPARWREFRAWVASQVAVALTLVPWLLLYIPNSTERTGFAPLSPLLYIRLVATLLPTGQSAYLERYTWIAVIFSAIVACGLWSLFRDRRLTGDIWLVPGIALLVGPALLYVLSLPASAFYSPRIVDRYLLIFLPIYGLVLSTGLLWLVKRSRMVGIAAAFVVLGILTSQVSAYYATRQYESDPKAAARLVQECFQPGDAVILNPDKDWPVYAYYLGASIPLNNIPYGQEMTVPSAAALADKFSGYDTVWLMEAPEIASNDPQRLLRAALAARDEQIGEADFGNVKVLVFRSKSTPQAFCPNRIIPYKAEGTGIVPAAAFTPIAATLANGIRLEAYGLNPPSPLPGHSFDVTLVWSCLEHLQQNYVVFVHVLDEQGKLVAQHDGAPLWGAYPTEAWACPTFVYDTHTVQLPPNLAPGTYCITGGLYDRQSGARVQVIEGEQYPDSRDSILVARFVLGSNRP